MKSSEDGSRSISPTQSETSWPTVHWFSSVPYTQTVVLWLMITAHAHPSLLKPPALEIIWWKAQHLPAKAQRRIWTDADIVNVLICRTFVWIFVKIPQSGSLQCLMHQSPDTRLKSLHPLEKNMFIMSVFGWFLQLMFLWSMRGAQTSWQKRSWNLYP